MTKNVDDWALVDRHENLVYDLKLKLGVRGKYFDHPEIKRGYSYYDQPDNLAALKIGRGARNSYSYTSGDDIDRGLALLKELQREGFGIFELNEQYDD